jgi:hypothetical protein
MVDPVQHFHQFIAVRAWLYPDKIFTYRGDKHFAMSEVFSMKYACALIQQGVTQMEITEADERHISAIQQIYAWHVLHGTATFETEPPDVAEMTARQKIYMLPDSRGLSRQRMERFWVIVTFHFTVKDAHTDSLWKIPYT